MDKDMDSEGKRNEVVRRSGTSLLPHDLKEIETVSLYADKQEINMGELTEYISKIGKLKLIWESKVPQKNQRFYYFFTFKRANRDEILEEIGKYSSFYKQMNAVANSMKDDKETENGDVYSLILELYERLQELEKAAEIGMETTGSTTVYRLHKEFLSLHEKLENMIKRVECVSWKKAAFGFKESINSVNELRNDLKESKSNYDNLCSKFDEVLSQNRKLIQQQNILLEEHGQVMLRQKEMMEEKNRMKEQTDLLIGIVATLAEKVEKNNTK